MSWRCRGAFVVPWPRFAWPCHPTTCRLPPSSSRPEGRRPAVEGPVQTALPQGTRRHAAAYSPIGVNVDLRPSNAVPQQQKRCRFATLKNGFLDPRCFALLRTASLGMTVLRGSPLREVGWHIHARLDPSAPGGMPTLAWACPGDAGGRSSSHGHALRGHATQRIYSPPPYRHPDRRAEGPQWRDPFKQHFHKAPDAEPQQHQRCRCATLKNGFLDPRCFALLRTASLGMTMMGPPDTRPRTG